MNSSPHYDFKIEPVNSWFEVIMETHDDHNYPNGPHIMRHAGQFPTEEAAQTFVVEVCIPVITRNFDVKKITMSDDWKKT